MDALTRSRYLAWRKRKLKRRITILLVLLLIFVGISVWGVSSLINRGVEPINDETDHAATVGDTSEDVSSENDKPQVEIEFCGATDREDTIILTNDESLEYTALVNRCYRMPSGFSPPDLSVVNALNIYEQPNQWIQLRQTAARALEDLLDTAYQLEGHVVLIISGYRSYEQQVSAHEHHVQTLGVEEARRISARPGHSEHQLGLAIDLSTPSLGGHLSADFSSKIEGAWIVENAHKFGFIISYPTGREEDTGFVYEPWHLRYVGAEVATIIFENGWILEEFIANQ